MEKSYKVFYIQDPKKRKVGKVTAKDLQEAFIKASYVKKLGPRDFRELYDIVEIP